MVSLVSFGSMQAAKDECEQLKDDIEKATSERRSEGVEELKKKLSEAEVLPGAPVGAEFDDDYNAMYRPSTSAARIPLMEWQSVPIKKGR